MHLPAVSIVTPIHCQRQPLLLTRAYHNLRSRRQGYHRLLSEAVVFSQCDEKSTDGHVKPMLSVMVVFDASNSAGDVPMELAETIRYALRVSTWFCLHKLMYHVII
jgi:hypothetical protein